MPLFSIERETRDQAIERFRVKQKGKLFVATGILTQAGGTSESVIVTIKRRRRLNVYDYEGLLGKISFPLLPKKETAILPLGE